jgi:hypothetical protein
MGLTLVRRDCAHPAGRGPGSEGRSAVMSCQGSKARKLLSIAVAVWWSALGSQRSTWA